jgi:hypothetical protein
MAFTTIDLDDPLPLVYLEIIDWDQTLTHKILTFANDDAIVNFLCANDPTTGSHHELNSEVFTHGGVKFYNYKMNKIKEISNGENHSMTVSDQEKLKIKIVSNGENLLEELEDRKFDTLPKHFQERSKFLIEPTQSINISDTK